MGVEESQVAWKFWVPCSSEGIERHHAVLFLMGQGRRKGGDYLIECVLQEQTPCGGEG